MPSGKSLLRGQFDHGLICVAHCYRWNPVAKAIRLDQIDRVSRIESEYPLHLHAASPPVQQSSQRLFERLVRPQLIARGPAIRKLKTNICGGSDRSITPELMVDSIDQRQELDAEVIEILVASGLPQERRVLSYADKLTEVAHDVIDNSHVRLRKQRRRKLLLGE